MLVLYDYECKSCGRVIDMLVSNKDELVTCEICGNQMVWKFPAPSIRQLNSKESINEAIKRRSEAHSRANYEKMVCEAYERDIKKRKQREERRTRVRESDKKLQG